MTVPSAGQMKYSCGAAGLVEALGAALPAG
jgi:hypothetical protein